MNINIKMIDGNVYEWVVTPDTEYDFMGRFFVVKNKEQWVGMYAIDRILVIEVR